VFRPDGSAISRALRGGATCSCPSLRRKLVTYGRHTEISTGALLYSIVGRFDTLSHQYTILKAITASKFVANLRLRLARFLDFPQWICRHRTFRDQA
jgi:hypothetical protein